MPETSAIPIPGTQRWKDLRLRFLPLLIFAATLAGIVHIWHDTLMPSTFSGQVELIESRVTSAEAGTLTQLNVSRFQTVQKGMPVAVVDPVDRRVLGYEVRLQRLRAVWLEQKVALATADSNLQFAEVELGRAEHLFKKKVISPQEFDAFQKKKQSLQTDVAEKNKLVADLERQINAVQSNPAAAETVADPASVGGHEEKTPLAESAIGRKILTAPIDGMVEMIFHRPGENITPGEPILTIAASSATHVIGYLREPISLHPEVGMDVRIRSHDARRSLAYGKVTRVGVAFEPIVLALQNPMISRITPEIGLPVEVTLPPGVQLRPGGIVDLTLMPGSKPGVVSR
jgi:multidrug resistance efflux pump